MDTIQPATAMYERDITCRTLGIQLDDLGPGRARMRMRVAGTMANGHGTVHGGYLFLLADAAFAYASNSHGPTAVAQHAQVTFLRAAAVDDELVAEAVERGRVGRTGVYDVTVRRAAGEVIAEFRGQSVMLSSNQSTTPGSGQSVMSSGRPVNGSEH
ncbi:hydroxyphenylacetyl-CoA thioesterase PaaI [Actinoplanes sichuanensis]|uniref:Hydroxyphenylacetyl-CoA thioesterase PaaI n=1 Tax=Actinoplanes sichuanensis TaxID=512349 RepID=A0ABW4AHN8_9ACTN|nr:hydroxyphenylacetyl-CoA thioesterase PaaI [Actinoplanes sichuanensis]